MTSAGEPMGTTNCGLPNRRAPTEQSNDRTTTPTTTHGQARLLITESNDEVERRGASPASNEAALSESSTPSLAHRRRYGPRSLEPNVRGRFPSHTIASLWAS